MAPEHRVRVPAPCAMVTRGEVEAALAVEDDADGGHLFEELLAAGAAGDEAAARELLQQGADARHQDPGTGQNALMAAAGAGHEAVTRLLLRSGVRCCAVRSRSAHASALQQYPVPAWRVLAGALVARTLCNACASQMCGGPSQCVKLSSAGAMECAGQARLVSWGPCGQCRAAKGARPRLCLVCKSM